MSSNGPRCTPHSASHPGSPSSTPSRSRIARHRSSSSALPIPSNLLAHHLDVLEDAGLIERSRSSGDGRRRYVHLRPGALDHLRTELDRCSRSRRCSCAPPTRPAPSSPPPSGRALTDATAESAGTHPAERRPPRRRRRRASRRTRPHRRDARLAHRARHATSVDDHGVRPGPRGARPRPRLAALVDPRPGPRPAPAPRSTPPSSSSAAGSATWSARHDRARPSSRDRHRRPSPSTSTAASSPKRSAPAC